MFGEEDCIGVNFDCSHFPRNCMCKGIKMQTNRKAEQMSKQVNKETRNKQANKQISKYAKKQTSKQAREQTKTQARRRKAATKWTSDGQMQWVSRSLHAVSCWIVNSTCQSATKYTYKHTANTNTLQIQYKYKHTTNTNTVYTNTVQTNTNTDTDTYENKQKTNSSIHAHKIWFTSSLQCAVQCAVCILQIYSVQCTEC